VSPQLAKLPVRTEIALGLQDCSQMTGIWQESSVVTVASAIN
jgi:hypothetical protein